MNESRPLAEWISHVFDHPVADPQWYWSIDAPEWEDAQENIAVFIAETFESSGQLLRGFSDAQLNQGLWYMAHNANSDFMYSLVDEQVPEPTRLRALRSFVPLFEQVMKVRCSPHLSHIDEPGSNPLNSICYMWWDILPFHGRPDDPTRSTFDREVLAVLSRLLSIPHDACRESALHGLGHWAIYYPKVASIVQDFLSHTPGLRPELSTYAQRAKGGCIQ